jgi:hypothetical protein
LPILLRCQQLHISGQGIVLDRQTLKLTKFFFVAILLPHHHHKGDMRQPDMAFIFREMFKETILPNYNENWHFE